MSHFNEFETFFEFLERNKKPSEELTCEDFGIGIADCGADQGIPHGGDCKAVVVKRMDGGTPKSRFRKILKRRKKNKK